MLNVLCTKYGTKYDSRYVNHLYCMVKRNLKTPFRFVCFTDNPSGIMTDHIQTFPLPDPSLIGWWSKLAYFKYPLYDIQGTILSFDLDMIILNSLDDLVSYAEFTDELYIMKDHFHQNKNNSSVMMFEAGTMTDVYDNFKQKQKDILIPSNTGLTHQPTRDAKSRYWGDQVWISEQRPYARNWPTDWILTWKWDVVRGKKPIDYKKTKIIIFTGKPNPHEIPNPELKKLWSCL